MLSPRARCYGRMINTSQTRVSYDDKHHQSACGGSRHPWSPVFAVYTPATACVSVNYMTVRNFVYCLPLGSGLPIYHWHSGETAETAMSQTLIINTQVDEHMISCRSLIDPSNRMTLLNTHLCKRTASLPEVTIA